MTETTQAQRFEDAAHALAAAIAAVEKAEAAFADLTHPHRDGETAEIRAAWGRAADMAYDEVAGSNHALNRAVGQLDIARRQFES